MFKKLLEKLKKRFATLETLVGSIYFIVGLSIFFAKFFYILDLPTIVVQIASFLLIYIGAYKVYVNRG